MSTACRRLKSPWSLSGTCTQPTMFTKTSQSRPWMIHSHPFCFTSICPPNARKKLFQTLMLRIQNQVHGCVVRGELSHNGPHVQLICFLFVSHQADREMPDMEHFHNSALNNWSQFHGIHYCNANDKLIVIYLIGTKNAYLKWIWLTYLNYTLSRPHGHNVNLHMSRAFA